MTDTTSRTPATTTPARTVLNRYLVVGVVLAVSGVLVMLIGWPRAVDCAEPGLNCDGTSGHWVCIPIGLALVVAALYPLVVHASATGARLMARATRETEQA